MAAIELRGSPVWWVRTRGTIYAVALGWATLATAQWRPAVVPLVVLTTLSWLGWTYYPDRPRVVWVGLLVLGAASLCLSILTPWFPAMVYPAVGAITAGARLRRWPAIAYASGVALACIGGLLIGGASPITLAAMPAAMAVGLLLGVVRRQNQALVREGQRMLAEQARSHVLAERARIAREIHDVLAHSLSALSVQLETADALLESGRVDQARKSVLRAAALARGGMTETRRAVAALREDALPIRDLLQGLLDEYRLGQNASVTLDVSGTARPLPPEAALTLYRTAQEATTNAAKHAPGADLAMSLRYQPDTITLTVVNSTVDTAKPLAHTGGGYGLTGLRERAELAGGTFSAHEDDDRWRIEVRIPA